MTKSIPPAPREAPWYFRPAVVLPVVAAMIVLGALVTPDVTAGDSRLTTYSSSAEGAHLFFELAQRLGWQTEQRFVPEAPDGDRVIHAVLSPDIPLRRSEVHELLERVRNGGALLVVADGAPLTDSLRVLSNLSGSLSRSDTADAPCPKWPRTLMAAHWPGGRGFLTAVRWRGAPPESLTTFLEVARLPGDTLGGRNNRPAFVGFPLGRGRVALATDGDVFRNDALRMCGNGLDVAAIRGLEYLRDGNDPRRTRIVFDEFHHGFGVQPGAMGTVVSYLGVTPSGHAFAQLLLAGLVLLFAAAPRLIQPRDPERIERRSPLEHIDALARAYIQVGATRTAVARLVRGIRRRRERSAIHSTRDANDDAFLTRVEHAAPALAGDVADIRRALTTPITRRELDNVGGALQRLENFLTRK